VIRAPVPVHGKVWEVTHEGRASSPACPRPFHATRYHSLVVERSSLPAELESHGRDGRRPHHGPAHRELPIHGVQFHPESIASEHGHALLKNFLDTARVAA
jgi:anthranilate synthase component 2